MSQSQGHRPQPPCRSAVRAAVRARRVRRRVRRGCRGTARDRVLPLALAGLAALAHRGAFGADGESSDGAGVAAAARPVACWRSWPATRPPARPGIVSLFLPRGRAAERAARALVEAIFDEAGLAVAALAGGAGRASTRWGRRPPSRARRSPRRSSRARSRAARTIPGPISDDAFERRLVVARRRLETAARAAGGRLAELSVPSASARTIVYKGLVSGGRLPELYPDLRAGWAVGYAVFHQRYATNTQPVWRLAQPFRSIAHNGEINTVRGNREQVRGRDGGSGRDRDRPRPAGGRSAAGRRRLRLAVARRGARAPDDDRLGSRLGATHDDPRGDGPAPRPAPARGDPSAADGRVPRAVGRPGRDRVRRWAAGRCAGRPERAAPGGVRRDPRPARRRGVRGGRRAVQRGRDGSARTARAGRAAAGRAGTSGDPRGHRGEGPGPAPAAGPRCAAADVRRPTGRRGWAPATDVAPRTDHRLRYLAGLDAERARLDIKTMALEGHEPLWSMGDDTPTPGRARLDRPVADHLRQAFAQVTNPAIDPERERIVMDLRVELGRRPPLLGGPPRAPRTMRLERPVVVDLDGLLAAAGSGDGPGRGSGRSMRPGIRRAGPEGLRGALDRLAAEAVTAARRDAEVLVLTDAACSLDRLPVPSILAVGAVHTALTGAGLRGRADLVVSAVDILDVHAMAMVLAVGATAVHPRLAIELAGRAGGQPRRGDAQRERSGGQPRRGVRGRTAQDARPDGHLGRRVVRRWGTGRRRRPRSGCRRPLLPDGRRVARPDDPRGPCRSPASTSRGGARDPRAGARSRAEDARPGLRTLPGRW